MKERTYFSGCLQVLASQCAMKYCNLASQTLFPVLVGVAGSAPWWAWPEVHCTSGHARKRVWLARLEVLPFVFDDKFGIRDRTTSY